MSSLAEQLAAPFDVHQIHWRVGATTKDKTQCIPLAYLDARDVMERLDKVAGVDKWQCRYPFVGCCEIGLRVNDEWVWKANGAGESDIEAEKGQYSDAFKRAAVLWGIGRYLYDVKTGWVPLKDGKTLAPETLLNLSTRLEAWTEKKFKTGEKK